MSGPTFQTHPIHLIKLLEECHTGTLQLPDFQRSWVWDEDRIKSLIASISRAFPVGALMTLNSGGEVNFQPRPVEGAPPTAKHTGHKALLLDGQQRMTSLYQVTIRNQVVATKTPKNKPVNRWFYIDIVKALDPSADRDEAIVGIPENKQLRTEFGRELTLDLSSPEMEFKNLMFPMTRVFDWDEWQDGFDDYWKENGDTAQSKLFRAFKNQVLENFKSYQVPVIALENTTSKEAVCVVFEKVNTGGKPLDAFELVTAIYAADNFELRKEWYGDDKLKGLHRQFRETLRAPGTNEGILAEVSNTDFLQVIALFHNRDRRREAIAAGKSGKELPAVTPHRQSLLSLPLDAYKKYKDKVADGFERAAKFLLRLHIYRVFDLPYQSQIVALAAILADLGDKFENEVIRTKLVRWYWNGVFGELYGSAVESRIARDFLEVPNWLLGDPIEPSTISETQFRADRLKTMRMRLSAAYKGMNALLMQTGAQDFLTGQKFDHTAFFGEYVDIHHIFPQDWCKKQGIPKNTYDSIINKTPLSYRTNRVIGGMAPSQYLAKLEQGTSHSPGLTPTVLDGNVMSHLVDPLLLRSDDFEAFMADRQKRLLGLIEVATGKPIVNLSTGAEPEEGEAEDEDV
jgi:hypothetical protein